MSSRIKPWQLAGVAVLLCIAAVAVARWFRVSQPYDGPRLLATLPADRATLLYVDTELLRKSGGSHLTVVGQCHLMGGCRNQARGSVPLSPPLRHGAKDPTRSVSTCGDSTSAGVVHQTKALRDTSPQS